MAKTAGNDKVSRLPHVYIDLPPYSAEWKICLRVGKTTKKKKGSFSFNNTKKEVWFMGADQYALSCCIPYIMHTPDPNCKHFSAFSLWPTALRTPLWNNCYQWSQMKCPVCKNAYLSANTPDPSHKHFSAFSFDPLHCAHHSKTTVISEVKWNALYVKMPADLPMQENKFTHKTIMHCML